MHRFIAFFASFGLHAGILVLLVATGLFVRHEQRIKNGSPAMASALSKTNLVLMTVSAGNPAPAVSPPVTPSSPPDAAKPPVILPHDDDLPVLPAAKSMTAEKTPPAVVRSDVSGLSKKAASAKKMPPASRTPLASSFATGENSLPHPPYPEQARSLRQTGTVVMDVEFDAEGSVAYAQVTQSSGVHELDSSTQRYIRDHWHSAAYAGQIISVPVEYKLEKF